MVDVGARLRAQNTPLVGAILAGGNATRMGGGAKGLLEVGGRRMIDRVADAMMPVVDSLFIVANASDAERWMPGVTVVRDELIGGGSTAGVHAALGAAHGPVLAVAWDLPFVTTGLLMEIAARAREHVMDADAVVCAGPRSGALEPLCAWYGPACADVIRAEWDSGDRSMHGLLRRVRTIIVSGDAIIPHGMPERLFFNVNAPDDLVTARAMAAGA